jgi:hypothetical protein
MALPNIFTQEVTRKLNQRLHKITHETQPTWGKMNAGQMLAHCNVTYEMAIEEKHAKAKGLKKLILTKFVKPIVTGEKPYKKNSRTAPEFLVSDKQDFDLQMKRIKDYLSKTVELGTPHFEGKMSNSFGNLKAIEWNNMFYKHLNHHLIQFGV